MTSGVLSDRYETLQQLSKKSGRRTLLARDIQTQELVVIKLLSFGNDFEWDDWKLFQREAETLQALSHPAIPRYLNHFEIDSPNSKGFALVQSYIEAKSLEEQLTAGRTFSEAEVKEIAKALLEILIYLHRQKPPVIHRDIKPSNILLTNRSAHSVDQLYLVDFGSVQTLAAREGGTITVVGTYGYMPPEQFGGRAVPASDLYSLGATLIYLVTGTHPADLLQKDLQIQFEQVAHLSSVFRDWLKWMTEPSLNQRLTSAQEALTALEEEQQRHNAVPAIRQPPGSKVLLNKSTDALEILLPAKGLRLTVAEWRLLTMMIIIFTPLAASLHILYLLVNSFSFPGLGGEDFLNFNFFNLNPFDWLSSLMILSIFPLFIQLIPTFIFHYFGKIRLYIDRQKMTLSYEWLGLKYHRHVVRQHIWKLVQKERPPNIILQIIGIPSYYGTAEEQLLIWAGTQKYEVCDDRVTPPELDWLAQELSDWLGLSISTD